jgi:glycosyltransferase involved in cell wall biosynthesis
LRRAICSVLDQLESGDELLVVDDGSTDQTSRVLQEFAGRIISLQGAHRGAGAARNIGIAHAQKDLVAFLDSDDIWLTGKLELQRQLMSARPDLLYCFTNFEVERVDGSVQRRYLDQWRRHCPPLQRTIGTGRPYSSMARLPPASTDFQVYEADFYSLQLTEFYILTDTLVVRRSLAEDALVFAEDLPTYEELECFYRLARRGPGALLDADLVRQYEHVSDRLSDLSGLKKIDARLTLLQRHWGRDEEFQRTGSIRYRAERNRLQLQKAGHLITLGRNREARAALSHVADRAWAFRVLACMPSATTRSVLAAYRRLRALLGPDSVS